MSFDQVLMHCGAPALCGIKTASLFSMKMELYGSGSEKLEELSEYFAAQGIFIVPIQKKDNRMLFFVYNRELLEKRLSSKAAKEYLAGKGYPVNYGFEAVLRELLFRLMCYETFPHEIGFFLGYPLEDVIQFERLKGTGFKFSGYWKVYGDIESAMTLMNRYKNCSTYCSKQLELGNSIPAAAKNYRNKLFNL